MDTQKLSDLRRGTVRIARPGGQAAGTGFVVTDKANRPLIVTCSHVIHSCPQQKKQPNERPKQITFTFLANGETRQAILEPECWRGCDEGDVAVLRIEGALPPEVKPLPLGSSAETLGHQAYCVGMPKLKVQELGTPADIVGTTRGTNKMELLHLHSDQIAVGFSGAAIWDVKRSRVIGMVSDIATGDELKRFQATAFGIPTETLQLACPILVPSDEVCPYRGGEAFTRDDAAIFFGRSRPIDRVFRKLLGLPPFLVVHGPSGSGKSSLMQAGVIPQLKEGSRVPGSRNWKVIYAPQAEQPLLRLEEQGLEGASAGLVNAVRKWRQTAPRETRLVLIVDQAEQLFEASHEAAGKAFLSGVAAVLGDSSLQPVTIMLVMRSDSSNRFSSEAGPLSSHMQWDRVNLSTEDTLDVNDLRDIVEQPIRDLGWKFDDGLASAIVRDAIESMPAHIEEAGIHAIDAARDIVLPLLESTLNQLWEKKREGRLTWEAYREIGGVIGALPQRAESAYLRLQPPQQAIARCIFTDLVHVGNSTQDNVGNLKRKSLADVCHNIEDRTAVMEVVRTLTDCRLLVTGEDKTTHEGTVEIIHDALLRRWVPLATWLNEDPQFLRWLEDITEKSRGWMETGSSSSKKRRRGRLMTDAELNQAEHWLSKYPAHKYPTFMSDDVRMFIREGRESARIEKRNRTWGIVATLLFVVMTIVSAGYSWYSENMRQVDNAQSVSALAINQIGGGNLEEGLRNAMKAVNIRKQLTLPVSVSLQDETALHLGLAFPPPSNRVVWSDHTNPVMSAAYSPKGTYIVTADNDGIAFIYDARTNEKLHPLKVGNNKITGAAFNWDETYLVTSSTDESVKLWKIGPDRQTLPQLERQLEGHTNAVRSASFNPTGDRIVTTSIDEDSSARVWDPMTGKEVFSMTITISNTQNMTITNTQDMSMSDNENEKVGFWSAAYSPDGNYIVTGNTDGNVRIWNAMEGPTQGTVLTDLIGHNNDVLQAKFSPDGKYIASASTDNTSRIWETKTWRLLQILRGHTGEVRTVAFSPDSKNLVTASEDGTARIWSVQTGEMLLNVRPHSGPLTSATYSPDGKSILTTSEDKTVSVWEPMEGKELPTLRHEDSLSRAAYSPDGKRAATASTQGKAWIWDAITGTKVLTLTADNGHKGFVYSAVFSPDTLGKYVLTSGQDATAKIWDAHAITQSVVLTTFTDIADPKKAAFNSALFSPDGKRVATAGADGIGLVWDIDTGKLVFTLKPRSNSVMHTAAYSADGKLIATCQSNGAVEIWDAETGKSIRIFDPWTDPVMTAFFSPDGKRLVVATGITAQVLDAQTGKIEFVLTGHNAMVSSAVFSPDGQFIVTSSLDRTARIWDAATGNERATLPGHTGGVRSAVFSPDGNSILTSSYDRTARQYFTRLEDQLERARTLLPDLLPTPTP